MAQTKDRGAIRDARSLLTRHGLDITRADVSVLHQVCYIRGLVTAMPGRNITDVKAEVNRVSLLIRQKPGIRNVIVEV